jgi:hypothetical protein
MLVEEALRVGHGGWPFVRASRGWGKRASLSRCYLDGGLPSSRYNDAVYHARGTTMLNTTVLSGGVLLLAALSCARGAAPPATSSPTPEALAARIEALKAPRVAWRDIAWKSCLLEGLAESRAKGKPVLVWVFIDRPTDDARC